MRVLLTGAGSRGDFQPMLALAVALEQAGHDVHLLGSPGFRGEAEAFGIPFSPSGMDAERMITDSRREAKTALGFVRALNRILEQEFHAQLAALDPLLEGVDVCAAGGASLAAPLLCEARGIPYRYFAYTPQVLKSSHHAPIMLPLDGLPSWTNRLLWAAMKGFYNRMMSKQYQLQRTSRGLPRTRDIYDELFPAPRAVIACDPEILPSPPDLAGVPQLGSFGLPDQRPLPPEVEAFLTRAAAPVYVGFGSMPDEDPARTTRLIVEAARRAEVRLLLSSGWAALGGDRLGEDVLVLPPVSHALLFPRVAAVVHHGGAGTTAAAARAGVPQAIVPHAFDQFIFGRQVTRQGLGTGPIPRTRLSVGRLSEAMRRLVTEERLKVNARVAAERIRARAPLAAAVSWLEAAALPAGAPAYSAQVVSRSRTS